MTQEARMKLINETISGFGPVEDPVESEFSQNHSLAQAYAIKGFRDYLQRAIKSQVAATLNVATIEDLNFNKGRILVLKELLDLCKRRFEESLKINLNKGEFDKS